MAAIRGTRVRRLLRLPEGLAEVLLLWLVLRIGLSLIAAVLFFNGSVPTPCNSDLVLNGWTTLPPLDNQGIAFPLIGVWQHWDACWYAKIAYWGYQPGAHSTNFFPLLPLLMSVGSRVLAGDVNLAALVINGIALVAALFGLRQLVRQDFDAETADRAVLYQAVFPVAFFFFAPFTEALFLAGSVWALLGARRRNWRTAAVAGFIAGLARPTGFVLLLPIGWEAALALRDRRRAAAQGAGRVNWRDAGPFIAAASPAIAYAGYVAFTGVVGEPYVLAHSFWLGQSQTLRLPWETIALAWDRVIEVHDIVTLLNLAALLLFLGLFVAGIRRLPASYSLVALPQLALILSAGTLGPLESTMRYVMVIFPGVVTLALMGRRGRFHRAWLALSLFLLGLLTALFLQGTFIA